MNICMLTSSFPRYPGDSAGVFVSDLSCYLSQRGCIVSVLAPHDYGSKMSDIQGNLIVKRFRYFFPEKYQKLCYGSGIVKNLKTEPISLIQVPIFILSQLVSAIKILKNKKIDIIHAHWSFPQGLIGLLCKYLHNIPYIVTIHGSDIYGLNYPILSNINRLVLRHAAACTVNSEETARVTNRLSGLKNIQIVPMGVDTELFNNKKRKLSPNSNCTRRKSILFAGRLIDWKGVDFLLMAIPIILNKFPKTTLRIVGNGPERLRLEQKASDLGIENNVLFLGQIPHNELVDYYSMADVFVLPSNKKEAGETEGLGVVLLEAMACNIPVVGSNVGGIPSIVKHEKTGLLAKPGDPEDLSKKICILLENEDLRDHVIENARQMVLEKFTWETIADKFISIYETTIQRKLKK